MIIKKLAEEFNKQFTCLGDNTEKYIIFTVLIEKEATKTDKNGEEFTKNISYILQFIDSASLWQAHYQILSTIYLKELIKLGVINTLQMFML